MCDMSTIILSGKPILRFPSLTLYSPELSVADSFFVAKRPSIAGLAAIIISLDQCEMMIHPTERTNYLNDVSGAIGILHDDDEILAAQRRLRLLSTVNGG